jgi:Protein of unknown function (DUF3800)
MLRAYVDESGDKGTSPTATDFFVMSAIIVDDAGRAAIQGRLAAIRNHLNKPSGTVLHFARNIKDHGARVYVCRELAAVPNVTITNVILCKRFLTPGALMASDPQAVYLYTLRFTLERLSWIARDRGEQIIVTFAHVKNFPYQRLREYLATLRGIPTSIEWQWIRELLQVADIAASSTLKAFQPDRHDVTEERYVRELATCLYRRPPGALTSYGMKVHPSSVAANFPWIATL